MTRANDTSTSHHCRDCGFPLTAIEAEYYGNRCEQHEREWFMRVENWRYGGSDAALDAKYSSREQQGGEDA